MDPVYCPGTVETFRSILGQLAPDDKLILPDGDLVQISERTPRIDGKLGPHYGYWALTLHPQDPKDLGRCASITAAYQWNLRTIVTFRDGHDATWSLEKPKALGDILKDLRREIQEQAKWATILFSLFSLDNPSKTGFLGPRFACKMMKSVPNMSNPVGQTAKNPVSWPLSKLESLIQAEIRVTMPDKERANRPVGRPCLPEEEWQARRETVEEVLQMARDEGISEKTASELLGLVYNTFRYWKRRTKKT